MPLQIIDSEPTVEPVVESKEVVVEPVIETPEVVIEPVVESPETIKEAEIIDKTIESMESGSEK
jgi:hypothetical protein